MKLLIITILLSLIQLSTFAQLKKVKNKISKNEYEIYYVSKTQADLKNGEYNYFKNKTLRKKGYYKNNKKDSIWTFYSTSGIEIQKGKFKNDKRTGLWKEIEYPKGKSDYKYIVKKGIYTNGKKDSVWNLYKYLPENKSEVLYATINYKDGLKDGKTVIFDSKTKLPKLTGNYKNGKMVGEWKIFNGEKLVQIYDFTKDSLINIDKAYVEKNKVVRNGKFNGLVYLSRKADYEKGDVNLLHFIAANLKYPKEALQQNIRGQVYVSFQIDSDGSLSDFKILRGIGHGCDEEAVKAIKLTSKKWLPALFVDKPIPTRRIIPVSFR